MSRPPRARKRPASEIIVEPEPQPGPSKKLGRGEFQDFEDAQLYGALLKYGPLDIQKILEDIPTRNEYQVKQRIAALQRKAQESLTTMVTEYKSGQRKTVPRQKVALDKWIDDLLNLQSVAEIMSGPQEELPARMLARSMGFIAKYEQHPSPGECGGVDLKNVYEFLEYMMLGLPSKVLSSADAKFLLEALQRLSTKLDDSALGGEIGFLVLGKPHWKRKGQKPRTYGKQCQDKLNGDDILNFLDQEKYNPFKVPKEWLKRSFNFSSVNE